MKAQSWATVQPYTLVHQSLHTRFSPLHLSVVSLSKLFSIVLRYYDLLLMFFFASTSIIKLLWEVFPYIFVFILLNIFFFWIHVGLTHILSSKLIFHFILLFDKKICCFRIYTSYLCLFNLMITFYLKHDIIISMVNDSMWLNQ